MRVGFIAIAIGLLALSSATGSEAFAANPNNSDAAKRKTILLHLNCSPLDDDAVSKLLNTALEFCKEQSDVTIFIDLQAVVLAKRKPDNLSKARQANLDEQFDKLQKAGAKITLCPHCAGQFGIKEGDVRRIVRYTTKREIDDLTKKADMVYEFKTADEIEADREANDRST